jgi:hypothetical protein
MEEQEKLAKEFSDSEVQTTEEKEEPYVGFQVGWPTRELEIV